MPRRAVLNETRNEHQLATAQRFCATRNVSVAMDESELLERLEHLQEVALTERIGPYASKQLLMKLQTFLNEAQEVSDASVETQSTGMISVIVPAHNEETVIVQCLESLLNGAQPSELEIIVSCNGCTDNTAKIARGFGAPVRVLETDKASKIVALNAGDEVACSELMFYIDADVVIGFDSIRKMAVALERGDGLVADVRILPEFNVASSVTSFQATSWLVWAYYKVWTQLPYNRTGVGTAFYALSREGRRRFSVFPDVIADDGFVRALFQADERIRVKGAYSTVRPPANLWSLIKTNTRSRLGGYQLLDQFPDMPVLDAKSFREILGFLMKSPLLWLCMPVYVFVNWFTRLRARKQHKSVKPFHWERDESSRVQGRFDDKPES
ncbi:glycosyl transferase, group 2 family protein [Candidatus Thiomargarita nelsonii]|uniref:Glycosyl transferase, group 2 family protein n=1 Tax=Candidatus Thiomargarita nelsonii TaxID=1003181 RepID=A0A176RW10_9GAMM|nr:glycosyl transferase, group 2 family protein [Candidatus Thiomargarita nelsonii]